MNIEEPNIKKIVSTVIKNHGNIAEANRVTGVSRSYFSRVMSGDLKPKSVRPDVYNKLMKGLTAKQRDALLNREKDEPLVLPSLTKEEAWERFQKLSPVQMEAMFTIVEILPGQ